MQPGTFYRQLKALNPELRICDFGTNNKLAGLYILGHDGEEYFDICGVDKGWVPEYTEWDQQGHIVKSGWRRVFLMLLQLRLTTKAKIRKVCPGFFAHWSQAAVDEDRRVQFVGDPIKNKLEKFALEAPVRVWKDPDTGKIEEGTVLTDDQNLELAEDIRNKDPEHEKAELERERWFLDTWKKRGGNLADKPKI